MSTTSEFFKVKSADSKTLTLLKEQLVRDITSYKKMLVSHGEGNVIAASFNFLQITRAQDKITNLKHAICKNSNMDGIWIEL